MRFAIAVVLCAGACVPDELRTLEIPTSQEVDVPGRTIGVSNPLTPDDVFPSSAISDALSQAMQQSFATEEIDKDAVDSLRLTLLKATVTEPEENGNIVRTLGFLVSAAFFVGTEGVDPVLVAESEDGAFDDPPPVEYEFPLTDAELVDVLKAGDTIDMTAEVATEDPPQFATTIRFDVNLTVLVNPIGALNGR